ncbi:DAK2 domain-containing protein [Desulfolucanica intricata]|uniref:DAK2 domain-containing protein n=1 Tax=Desulfolucanica intricata TaxID=1285191 RepID=UPI00083752E2|nr:DAK2 domain-containing protein [Desulfolucanica intricata]
MSIYSFDGAEFRTMLLGSLNLLAQYKDEIDRLNIFPVPDGDTGTNMHLTLLAAVNEAQQEKSTRIDTVSLAVARGALMGARGNSGVLLSQLFRGFATALEGQHKANATDLARGFTEAYKTAYRTVSNPVPGTILTVAQKTAEAMQEACRRSQDVLRVLVVSLKAAQESLKETPELLPVLKESGVVDAGAKGFCVILEGILHSLKGPEELDLLLNVVSRQKEDYLGPLPESKQAITYKYCTEFIVKGKNIPLEKIQQELNNYGDCLMVVGDDAQAKVHLHSNHPGLVMEYCLNFGTLSNIHITNMDEQHRERINPETKDQLDKEIGIISVSMGEGIKAIMESLGADVVITGGQTMNPKTEDIVKAIQNTPAKNIIILPNNKNIILTAEQAARISSKQVAVVSTKSIPEGIAALMNFNPEQEFSKNIEQMVTAINNIITGEITTAVRNSSYDGNPINSGDFIALAKDTIIAAGNSLQETFKLLISHLVTAPESLVTCYYGQDIDQKTAENLIEQTVQLYPDLEIELHSGGQPVYHFIISVE